ncbi:MULTISPECIES: copper chaperone CopZ [unclassified Lysinibacillus]|uniref:copper chaperone CopZ n=1 Tax=unclassified Lysinibacillus TaxID=2636778 RepID=UPI0020125C88|nr:MULTISPECIES: copper chaperone CopZ [unclassified Lysinibacillus]MCL1698764.1 copper chaperone CopZ [Lysinibacillus sp. BPa_S21]MCL1703489.1 copper chaperone CopZ [Lysinibacillus sp. Bpr_S20]
MQNVTLNVQGMSCGHCVNSVEKSVGALTGVEQVKVNLADGLVDVAFDETKVSLDQIKETIDDQGYDVK